MEFGTSAEALGILSAAFFYSFALTQIPLAIWLDIIGPRISMTFLSLIGSLGALIFACSSTLSVAVFGRVLLGLGMAGNLVGSMKLFVSWFSQEKFATTTGILMSLGTMGNMVAATPLALMMEYFGWRRSFLIIGGLTVLFSLLFFILVRNQPGKEKDHREEKLAGLFSVEYLSILVASRDYWIISLGTFCRYGVFVAIQGLWAGPYLLNGIGLSSFTAGNVLIMLGFGYIIGSILSGWLSDRVMHSPKKVVITGFIINAVSLFALSRGCGGDFPVILGGIFLLIGISSAYGNVMYAHIKERMPVEMSGMALTGINLYTMLGGAFFMQIMGWFIDRMSGSDEPGLVEYHTSFLLCFWCIIIALVFYFLTRSGSLSDKGWQAPGNILTS